MPRVIENKNKRERKGTKNINRFIRKLGQEITELVQRLTLDEQVIVYIIALWHFGQEA